MMFENYKDSHQEFRDYDYDSHMLLKILNKASVQTRKSDDKELFVDENWKINSKNMNDKIPADNSNLKRILSEFFPDKKILIQENNGGSQTIFLS